MKFDEEYEKKLLDGFKYDAGWMSYKEMDNKIKKIEEIDNCNNKYLNLIMKSANNRDK